MAKKKEIIIHPNLQEQKRNVDSHLYGEDDNNNAASDKSTDDTIKPNDGNDANDKKHTKDTHKINSTDDKKGNNHTYDKINANNATNTKGNINTGDYVSNDNTIDPYDAEFRNVTTRMRIGVYERLQRIAYWERTSVVDILDELLVPHLDNIEKYRGKPFDPVPPAKRKTRKK